MSQKKITIPADIDSAVADLNGLGALITAKEWHRAAIVAAFVTLADGPGKAPNGKGESPLSFSKHGITGLKDTGTIRRYVKIWESTGQPVPKPGHEISLPNLPWAEWKDTLIEEGEITSKKATDYVTGPRVAEAIKDDPRIAEVAIKAAVAARPKEVATAVAKSRAVRTEIAEVDRAEVADRLKEAGLVEHTGSKTPEGKAVEATVASRNAVSDWLILVHEASVKLAAAKAIWDKIEGDLNAGDLFEANASLIETETDAVVLRQRVADKHEALSGTSV